MKKRFEGIRPFVYGDVWDKMTPDERRFAFWSDVVVALIGASIFYFGSMYLGV